MTDRGEEFRRRSEAKRQASLAAIEEVRSGKGRRRLEGRSRLNAALLVSQIFQQARRKGLRRDEIISAISQKLKGHRSTAFRLEKWTLPRKIEKIDEETELRFRKRSEPQKDTRVYIAIIEVLAKLAGLDLEDLLVEFSDLAGLEEDPRILDASQPEIEPADQLAKLLHTLASTVARRADLPRLWSTAERVQAGWDPSIGPTAKGIEDDIFMGRFSPKLPATAWEWVERSLPPYPSVKLLRIPYGRLTTDICIEGFANEVSDLPAGIAPYPSFKRAATLTAYWDLMLSVAPLGTFSVGAYFVRTSSVDVFIDDEEPTNQTVFPEEDIWSFVPNGIGAQIDWRQKWRRTIIDPKKFASMSEADWAGVYRPPRSASDKLDELPPSHDLPRARIVRVSASSIYNWLVDDLRWKRGDREVGVESCLDWNPRLSSVAATWFQGLSLARDLELALHSGEIERKLYQWIRFYKDSLVELEQNWLAAAQASEGNLRERWARDLEKEESDDE